VETKKNYRKFRYLVAVVGFLFVATELMFAFNEAAVYQSLICSVYLLFNILVDMWRWRDRTKVSYAKGRLIYGAILIPFWMLFNLLLGLIAPRISEEIIWLYSLAIIIALVIAASVPDYVIRERSFSEKKRRAVRRAIRVTLMLIVPYVLIFCVLSLFGVLSYRIQLLAVLAFMPLAFFTMMLADGIARSHPLEETLGIGYFVTMVTVIPFFMGVFRVLPASYQIPYICILIVVYASFIYWLRSVRAKNRQKRERKASKSVLSPARARQDNAMCTHDSYK
jgi:uncharacterized membrane protein (Fun14 family)